MYLIWLTIDNGCSFIRHKVRCLCRGAWTWFSSGPGNTDLIFLFVYAVYCTSTRQGQVVEISPKSRGLSGISLDAYFLYNLLIFQCVIVVCHTHQMKRQFLQLCFLITCDQQSLRQEISPDGKRVSQFPRCVYCPFEIWSQKCQSLTALQSVCCPNRSLLFVVNSQSNNKVSACISLWRVSSQVFDHPCIYLWKYVFLYMLKYFETMFQNCC